MSVAVTIRDVPDDVRNELAARAARAGQSLQEYLRGMLVLAAARPPVDDVIARARARVPRRSGRDRHREVEGQERLAALRLTADDADRLVAPQLVDEPSPLGRHVREIGGAHDRQDRRCRHRRAGFTRGGVALGRDGRWSALVMSR